MARGGKVLVPVFAVGRAQELLLMVEEYWERMGIKVSTERGWGFRPAYVSRNLLIVSQG